jgi:hypothetical protein
MASGNYTIEPGVVYTALQACSSTDDTAISGGVLNQTSGTNNWSPLDSFPAGNEWAEQIANLSGGAQTFTVYAICLPETDGDATKATRARHGAARIR